MNQNNNLHKREDGSYYLFSEIRFQEQQELIADILASYNLLAMRLTSFEHTAERAKNPDYLLGVIREGGDFIRQSLRQELEDSLKAIPVGKLTKSQWIESTLSELPNELFETVSKYRNDVSCANGKLIKRITTDDLVITVREDETRLIITIRDDFDNEVKGMLTEEVSEERMADIATFREAVKMLWSLADKGYFLGRHVSYASSSPVEGPSIVDSLTKDSICTNKKDRDAHISDEALLKSLHKRAK